ncbi:hypothetical protein Poly51_21170 [Rubripirellula tenax]|uniref:Stigma-specific protein, Stig1 n=1 Tax=Rubripirellula tenax TaxID=2528015 RepID=A0A5C6FI70_9BACT|nr:hypothetical protein [Rubripirellula tenax]TWU59329.1 hypothetical protein Poly51_21170 [Rubripirellula tenax]
MRISALSIALVVATTLASTASAKNDFSALLADLSFGDAPPSAAEMRSELPSLNSPQRSLEFPTSNGLEVAAREVAKELRPVPQSFALPVPQASLRDPFVANNRSSGPTDIDLNTAFAVQEFESSGNRVAAQSVGLGRHRAAGCDSPTCAGGNCGCGGCGNRGNETVIDCTPHRAPNLPSSSFIQYFRSEKCNTNVWDNYSRPCGRVHAHSHGTCDCFNKSRSCGELLAPCGRTGCGGCAGCDKACDSPCDTGCDR